LLPTDYRAIAIEFAQELDVNLVGLLLVNGKEIDKNVYIMLCMERNYFGHGLTLKVRGGTSHRHVPMVRNEFSTAFAAAFHWQ
jgi:hypothetical protein